ncbi:MAG: DAK2 domain-containing protein [Rhodobacteraceae bacterium]|nr:DAK2 domain-containing protein [Paracoccaceae bacterium]
MSQNFLTDLVDRFTPLEASLNKLDAATGDGDHGTTMLRGLRAAATADEPVAKAFRMAAGGASGSLFGVLIGAIESVNSLVSLGNALTKAADRIAQMGQAKAGDKTMLDALIPAANAALADPDDAAAAAAKAAQAGVVATKEMIAKRGRAKYVEGGGAGHIDAGATSVAEILTALEQHSRGTS